MSDTTLLRHANSTTMGQFTGGGMFRYNGELFVTVPRNKDNESPYNLAVRCEDGGAVFIACNASIYPVVVVS